MNGWKSEAKNTTPESNHMFVNKERLQKVAIKSGTGKRAGYYWMNLSNFRTSCSMGNGST